MPTKGRVTFVVSHWHGFERFSTAEPQCTRTANPGKTLPLEQPSAVAAHQNNKPRYGLAQRGPIVPGRGMN